MGSPDSRSTNLHACIGSQTTRGRARLSHNDTSVLPFGFYNTLGTPKLKYFVAQYLAYLRPCQRFAAPLRNTNA